MALKNAKKDIKIINIKILKGGLFMIYLSAFIWIPSLIILIILLLVKQLLKG